MYNDFDHRNDFNDSQHVPRWGVNWYSRTNPKWICKTIKAHSGQLCKSGEGSLRFVGTTNHNWNVSIIWSKEIVFTPEEHCFHLYRHSSIYAVNVRTQKQNQGSKNLVNRGYLVVHWRPKCLGWQAILLSKMVKWPQEKWACDFHDDAMPLSFQLQVTEDFFKSHNFFIMEKWPVSEEF